MVAAYTVVAATVAGAMRRGYINLTRLYPFGISKTSADDCAAVSGDNDRGAGLPTARLGGNRSGFGLRCGCFARRCVDEKRAVAAEQLFCRVILGKAQAAIGGEFPIRKDPFAAQSDQLQRRRPVHGFFFLPYRMRETANHTRILTACLTQSQDDRRKWGKPAKNRIAYCPAATRGG